MATVLLLQTSRWRDAADDDALLAAARELAPATVIAAVADPVRATRMTGLTCLEAEPAKLLRALSGIDLLVVLGGTVLTSDARTEHRFGLPELAGLTTAARAAGRRYALIGVGAGPIRTRRDAFCVRQIVGGSALTVLDDAGSVHELTAVGVPHPLRTGSDLSWLQLQEPPQIAPVGVDLWCTVTPDEVEQAGGPTAFTAVVAGVLDALRRFDAHAAGQTPSVTLQAWHGGAAAGDDLDAATEIADRLHDQGHHTTVTPPPSSLAGERDTLRTSRFCLSGHGHAMMAAAASGVPVLATPHEPVAAGIAERLALTVLTSTGGTGSTSDVPADRIDAAVGASLTTAGQSLALVRECVAEADEVAELLRMLVTHGEPDTRSDHPPRAHPAHPATGLRPTGVMR